MEKHGTSAEPKDAKESKPVEKDDVKKTAVVSESEISSEKTVRTNKRKLNLKKYRTPAMITVSLLVLLGATYHLKGIFVAAVVDGSPIGRLSVIRELEKQAGSQALDRLVTKKLVDAEVVRKKIAVSQSDMDAEVKKIEESVTKQGGTLAEALKQQGMTEADLREQMLLQKQLEKILGDKVKVTDNDVAQYMAQSKGPAPAGMSEEEFRDQIREQLKGQKFNVEVGKWISAAKAKASISYYAGYAAEAESAVLEQVDSQAE